MSNMYKHTESVADWRSICTLIIYIITCFFVSHPTKVSIYVPRKIWNIGKAGLQHTRILPSSGIEEEEDGGFLDDDSSDISRHSRSFQFPLDFSTAPVIAVLFLLAIVAVGKDELRNGVIGTAGIWPIEVLVISISLCYIGISIDASGLIRYSFFKVVQKANRNGRKLYLALYAMNFMLGAVIGSEVAVAWGSQYMVYTVKLIDTTVRWEPWLFTQFAVVNIASAILVPTNLTSLVVAGAFGIKFVDYTANTVVPCMITVLLLLPLLTFSIYPGSKNIPSKINFRQWPEEFRSRMPMPPTLVHQDVEAGDRTLTERVREDRILFMALVNPFLDKGTALFGIILIVVTLATALALNAITAEGHKSYNAACWVALSGAILMVCWNVVSDWRNRHVTRSIAQEGRRNALKSHRMSLHPSKHSSIAGSEPEVDQDMSRVGTADDVSIIALATLSQHPIPADDASDIQVQPDNQQNKPGSIAASASMKSITDEAPACPQTPEPNIATLASLCEGLKLWLRETFPTITAVVALLPYRWVPFILAMSVLVQSLSKWGWITLFAHGWNHWYVKTETIGAISGMSFLAVILCNIAGTGFGASLLLCRVVQAWSAMHDSDTHSTQLTDRAYWGTVYAIAIGVNFGAFSSSIGASLAGLGWRKNLQRRYLMVDGLRFARNTQPIITAAMLVGCAVLVGEVYLTRGDSPWSR